MLDERSKVGRKWEPVTGSEHFVLKMAATYAHHRCGAVNLRSKQSRFYLYL